MRPTDKIIKISINGNDTGLMMKLGNSGEAFFV